VVLPATGSNKESEKKKKRERKQETKGTMVGLTERKRVRRISIFGLALHEGHPNWDQVHAWPAWLLLKPNAHGINSVREEYRDTTIRKQAEGSTAKQASIKTILPSL